MELFEAVSNNDVIKVLRLLEKGTDPNMYDLDQHFTALHYAVQHDAIDVVLLLVTAGADLDTVTEENLTAMDIAKQQNNRKMITLLLKLSHMPLLKKEGKRQVH